MGKWCLHASSFIFDRLIIKVAGDQDSHKSSDELDFHGPFICFCTMVSGEQSLLFGLLVSMHHDDSVETRLSVDVPKLFGKIHE